VGESGSDEESSFSHTISGVQIRSGSERTTIGGALSASLCLPVSSILYRDESSSPGNSDSMDGDGGTKEEGRHEKCERK
jgi:hypothetical protein